MLIERTLHVEESLFENFFIQQHKKVSYYIINLRVSLLKKVSVCYHLDQSENVLMLYKCVEFLGFSYTIPT